MCISFGFEAKQSKKPFISFRFESGMKKSEAKRKIFGSETKRKHDVLISLWSEAKIYSEKKRKIFFFCVSVRNLLFPTRLLTSEDEYKWYWHQMIYFPETINTVNTRIYTSPTHSRSSSSCALQLTLCMLAS
jgi:hypothetical protein